MKTLKKTFISKPTYLYIQTIDILKFYFVRIVKVCFVFKNSHYVYILPRMHKALPTLGNEKEQ